MKSVFSFGQEMASVLFFTIKFYRNYLLYCFPRLEKGCGEDVCVKSSVEDCYIFPHFTAQQKC